MPEHDKPVLTSWKEIADHIGVNVRTAQKWEKSRGLPVQRLPGQKGRIFAAPEELQRWQTTLANHPHWWHNAALLRWYSVAVTLVALALAVWIAAERLADGHPGPPALFRAENRTLVVTDANGKELWRRVFDDNFAFEAYEGPLGLLRTAFTDVDGDSHVEFLFSYYSVKADTEGVALYCFSDRGGEKWKFVPGKPISDRGRTYPGPYIVTAFSVVDLGGKIGKVVAATCRHAVYYPNQFVLLDGHGHPMGEYWHSGHLDNLAFLDLDGDNVKEILLSGVNNGYETAALVALDAGDFSGASFQGESSPYQITGFPLHKERALILFPRTCINRKLGLYNMAHEIFTTDGRIRVHVTENAVEDFVIYTFDKQLNCVYAEATDGLRNTHLRLEAQGALNHSLTAAEANGWLRSVKRLQTAIPSPSDKDTGPHHK